MSLELQLNTEILEWQAEMLKAMAHPLRIRIITLLNDKGMLSVSEIQHLLQIEQSVASHHLGILKNKGLLLSRRDGKNIRYSLKHERIIQIIECMNRCNENI